MDANDCPKCGAPRVAADTCPHCGIIYAKYRVLPLSPPPATAPRQAPWPLLAGVIALAGLVVFLLVRSNRPPVPEVGAPIPATPSQAQAQDVQDPVEEPATPPQDSGSAEALEAAVAARAPDPDGEAPPSGFFEHTSDRGVCRARIPTEHGPIRKSRRSYDTSAGTETIHAYHTRTLQEEQAIQRYQLWHVDVPLLADAELGEQAYLESMVPRLLGYLRDLSERSQWTREGSLRWLEVSFRGLSRETPVAGRLRLTRATRGDLVALMVAGPGDEARTDPKGRAFFEAFSFIRSGGTQTPSCQASPGRSSRLRKLQVGQLPKLLRGSHGCVVLMEIYASWCPTCRQVLPEVSALAKRYASYGLVVHALATDEQESQIKALLRAEKPYYQPLLLERWREGELDSTLSGLGARYEGAIPYFAVFDRQGKLSMQHTGGGNMGQLEDRIRQLLQ